MSAFYHDSLFICRCMVALELCRFNLFRVASSLLFRSTGGDDGDADRQGDADGFGYGCVPNYLAISKSCMFTHIFYTVTVKMLRMRKIWMTMKLASMLLQSAAVQVILISGCELCFL